MSVASSLKARIERATPRRKHNERVNEQRVASAGQSTIERTLERRAAGSCGRIIRAPIPPSGIGSREALESFFIRALSHSLAGHISALVNNREKQTTTTLPRSLITRAQ